MFNIILAANQLVLGLLLFSWLNFLKKGNIFGFKIFKNFLIRILEHFIDSSVTPTETPQDPPGYGIKVGSDL